VEIPEVRFTHRENRAIAYQVFGTGGVDMLVISEWAANSDSIWEHPGHRRMWRYHGSLARVARFDRSGVGASDPPAGDIADVRQWAEDGVAVLNAIGAEKALIVGEGWGGQAAVAIAATHPERVERLMLANTYACMTRSDDYPEGLSERSVERSVDLVRSAWGTGAVIAQAVPSLAANYDELCGRYERAGASPMEAADMVRAAFTSDVRALLERVECPTLVLHTGDNVHVGQRHSEYLAQHIAGAKLVVTEGETYYDFTSELGSAFVEFLTGGSQPSWGERELAVVVFTDIVDSTGQLERHGDHDWKTILDNCDDLVEMEVRRAGGRVVKHTGDGHLLTFSNPGTAISGVMAIRCATHALGLSLRFGMHMGEVEARADGDVAGIVVHAAARIMAVASGDEIVVSSVIVDLIDGVGLEFDDRGSHELKGISVPMRLFALRLPSL
jgi:class 3 adenylate cyclase